MKLQEIRRDGFYTDGKNVYAKVKNNIVGYFCGKEGVHTAYCYDNQEVTKVTAGEEFLDGRIKVVDFKTLELVATIYNYFTKQFSNIEKAEKYAEENGVEVFDIHTYKEYVSVEFKKNTNEVEIVNFKDLK